MGRVCASTRSEVVAPYCFGFMVYRIASFGTQVLLLDLDGCKFFARVRKGSIEKSAVNC